MLKYKDSETSILFKEIKRQIKGTQYRCKNGYLFIDVDGFLIFHTCLMFLSKTQKIVEGSLDIKRSDIDLLYWDIFEGEQLGTKYSSIRVDGVFTVPSITCDFWSTEYYDINDNLEKIASDVIKKFEENVKRISIEEAKDCNYYSSLLETEYKSKGNMIILIMEEIYQNNYVRALEFIRSEWDKGENGRQGTESTNIYEFAEDYCLKRLREMGQLTKELDKPLSRKIKSSRLLKKIIG